jgi:hypothetical protein
MRLRRIRWAIGGAIVLGYYDAMAYGDDHVALKRALDNITGRIASIFAEDDPLFDRERFLRFVETATEDYQ